MSVHWMLDLDHLSAEVGEEPAGHGPAYETGDL